MYRFSIFKGDTLMTHSYLKSQLKAEYNYKIEPHAHTSPVSPCGEASPKEVVRIYKELGYDAICITNHFFLWLFENQDIYQNLSKEEKIDRYLADFYEAKLEGDKLGINVILGAELRFPENENDYLIFGVDRDDLLKIYDHLSDGVENFRKNLNLPNSVFIQAHPFRSPSTPADASLLDGIETFNLHIGQNAKIPLAVRYAKENNVNITLAGSDFHYPGTGNAGATALLAKTLPCDTFELADILKSCDYIFEIGGNAIILP